VIKNILYEIGDFNLNAQVVSISPSFYSVILIVVGSKSQNSTNVLTVIKFIISRFNRFFGFAAKAEVWDANWANAFFVT
jgi:APA family basic amino acid/polyamine antiporter